jgi:hypothetical protein
MSAKPTSINTSPRSEAKAHGTQRSHEMCNRTVQVFASQGFWANLIIGIVLLLVGPAFGLFMKNPKIAILAAACGLTLLIWLIAVIAIRQIDTQAKAVFKLSTIVQYCRQGKGSYRWTGKCHHLT